MIRRLNAVFSWIFIRLIALLLIFEEWGWRPLSRLLQRMARIPLWAWCEQKIAALPPWLALLVLLLPAVALLPIKLLALYFLGRGQMLWGTTVLITAKLLGTALVARLFQLTEPALMQFAWFARWYPRWRAYKDSLMAQVRASGAWRIGRQAKLQVKLQVKKAAKRLRAALQGRN